MEFPITVNEIDFESWERPVKDSLLHRDETGAFVSIKPCADEYGGKTYLGVLLGDIATVQGARFNKESGKLIVSMERGNPAIYVPDLKRVIFGFESWWGIIESAEQLRQITDDDIKNVWYVKALEALSKETEPA